MKMWDLWKRRLSVLLCVSMMWNNMGSVIPTTVMAVREEVISENGEQTEEIPKEKVLSEETWGKEAVEVQSVPASVKENFKNAPEVELNSRYDLNITQNEERVFLRFKIDKEHGAKKTIDIFCGKIVGEFSGYSSAGLFKESGDDIEAVSFSQSSIIEPMGFVIRDILLEEGWYYLEIRFSGNGTGTIPVFIGEQHNENCEHSYYEISREYVPNEKVIRTTYICDLCGQKSVEKTQHPEHRYILDNVRYMSGSGIFCKYYKCYECGADYTADYVPEEVTLDSRYDVEISEDFERVFLKFRIDKESEERIFDIYGANEYQSSYAALYKVVGDSAEKIDFSCSSYDQEQGYTGFIMKHMSLEEGWYYLEVGFGELALGNGGSGGTGTIQVFIGKQNDENCEHLGKDGMLIDFEYLQDEAVVQKTYICELCGSLYEKKSAVNEITLNSRYDARITEEGESVYLRFKIDKDYGADQLFDIYSGKLKSKPSRAYADARLYKETGGVLDSVDVEYGGSIGRGFRMEDLSLEPGNYILRVGFTSNATGEIPIFIGKQKSGDCEHSYWQVDWKYVQEEAVIRRVYICDLCGYKYVEDEPHTHEYGSWYYGLDPGTTSVYKAQECKICSTENRVIVGMVKDLAKEVTLNSRYDAKITEDFEKVYLKLEIDGKHVSEKTFDIFSGKILDGTNSGAYATLYKETDYDLEFVDSGYYRYIDGTGFIMRDLALEEGVYYLEVQFLEEGTGTIPVFIGEQYDESCDHSYYEISREYIPDEAIVRICSICGLCGQKSVEEIPHFEHLYRLDNTRYMTGSGIFCKYYECTKCGDQYSNDCIPEEVTLNGRYDIEISKDYEREFLKFKVNEEQGVGQTIDIFSGKVTDGLADSCAVLYKENDNVTEKIYSVDKEGDGTGFIIKDLLLEEGWYYLEVFYKTEGTGTIPVYIGKQDDEVTSKIDLILDENNAVASVNANGQLEEYGFILGQTDKDGDLDINSPGRIKINYSELSENNTYTLDVEKTKGMFVVAFASVQSEKGTEMIYSKVEKLN